ncbi:MAG TPA: hypothetical protein VEZ50_05405 [Nodosilinea sp.]|nr:hypothetical protein [Nodosilinea sp.]
MQVLKRVFNFAALRQWAIVFLAGLMVLVTTACGATQAATPPNNTAGANSAQSEGMYPHKDTTRDTSAADAKADRLIRQAEQRIESGSNNPVKKTADNIGKSTQPASDNIGKSTQRAADNVADSARKGLNQLGQGVKGAVNDAANAVD